MAPALFPQAGKVCSMACNMLHRVCRTHSSMLACPLGATTGFWEHPRLPLWEAVAGMKRC